MKNSSSGTVLMAYSCGRSPGGHGLVGGRVDLPRVLNLAPALIAPVRLAECRFNHLVAEWRDAVPRQIPIKIDIAIQISGETCLQPPKSLTPKTPYLWFIQPAFTDNVAVEGQAYEYA